MKSAIAEAIKLKQQPIAIIFTNDKPEGAREFKEGRWGCVVAMMTTVSKRGRSAAFSRKTTGCMGGYAGLGLGDIYPQMPGGIEYFLSVGAGEGYREGEFYKKTPELAKSFVDSLPYEDIPYEYVVVKQLSEVDETKEQPTLVSIIANADQLSALVVLANYGREGGDNVRIPFGAGCQTICLMPLAEAKRDVPRAIVGLTDISSRPYCDAGQLSFTVPWKMFLEMEQNAPESFLSKESWEKVARRIE